jgi:transcriptional regulator with XRE-family HTH domain
MADETPKTEFATLLKTLRKSRDLTQEALATSAGLSSVYITSLESGERKRPSRATILAIVRALKLTPEEADRLLASAGHAIPLSGNQIQSPLDDNLLNVIDELSKSKPQSFRRTLTRRLEIVARQHADSSFDLGIWQPDVMCGYSGFQDAALASFVAESLRIGSELAGWRKIPELLAGQRLSFAIHNASALQTNVKLVFCLPPLYTFRGYMIFVSKRHLGKYQSVVDASGEAKLADLPDEKKAKILRWAKIATETNTDFEVAVFKALTQVGLDPNNDVVIQDFDSEQGYEALLKNEVDAFCGGLNHAYALQKHGYSPLFEPAQIGLEAANGIVTTQEVFEEHWELLELFALLWFRNLELLKTKVEGGGNEHFLELLVRDLNYNTLGRMSVQDFRDSFDHQDFYTRPDQWQRETFDKYLKDLNQYYQAKEEAKPRLTSQNQHTFPELFQGTYAKAQSSTMKSSGRAGEERRVKTS